MVSKRILNKIILSIFVSTIGWAAQDITDLPNLHVIWSGDKSEKCQKLVDLFLKELKTIESDLRTDLEVAVTPPAVLNKNDISIECRGLSLAEPMLAVMGQKDEVVLNYQAKAQGFSASDWLKFQKTYLNIEPEIKNLNPMLSAVHKTETTAKVESFIYEKWWFWAGSIVVGGLVGFAVWKVNQPKVGVQVEIQ